MDRLFLTILNMSLTGAFVIAVICLARLPLRRVPKIISYCLWAVAGFRLAFPFTIERVWSLIPFRTTPIPTHITPQPALPLEIYLPAAENTVSGTIPGIPNNLPSAGIPDIGAAEIGVIANDGSLLQNLTTLGAAVWLIGLILMLSYAVVSYLVLAHKMQDAILLQANIYEAETVQTPFVLGIFAPKIYLPPDLSESEYRYIVLHEQTHIRRRDYLVKIAAYLILCLHWFNPLAWIAFGLMSTDMEMSCDEKVLKRLGSNIKSDYSRTLLTLATDWRICAPTPLAFSEGGVKRRIQHIMKFKKASRFASVIAVVLVITLSIGFAVSQTDEIADEMPEPTVMSEVSAPEPVQTPEIPEVTPAPIPAEFVAPQLTVEEDWHGDRPTHADTLSPEEAAQIGAQYIWTMFGESIDGKTVRMTYLAPEWSVRTYWRGTVIDFEVGPPWRLFFEFEIDALSGEWLALSNELVLNYLIGSIYVETDEPVWHNPPDPERGFLVTEEEWEEIQHMISTGVNLTDEEIEFYAERAMKFAARHFQDSSVATVSPFALAIPFLFSWDEDGTLIVAIHMVSAEATDDMGRTITLVLCSKTHQLLQIVTVSEITSGWEYDGPLGVG